MKELLSTDNLVSVQYYLHILRHRRWLVTSVLAAVVAATLWLTLRQTPMYVAQAELLIKSAASYSQPATTPNLDTEARLAQSEAVASLASEALPEPIESEDLLRGLSVDAPPNTQILLPTTLMQIPDERRCEWRLSPRPISRSNMTSCLRTPRHSRGDWKNASRR